MSFFKRLFGGGDPLTAANNRVRRVPHPSFFCLGGVVP
jgi:hypothetical protein